MYVDAQTIITAGAVLTAIVGFVTLGWKLFKWINHPKEQDQELVNLKGEIAELKKHHESDISNVNSAHRHDKDVINEEQTLVVYGLLACLKGLAEQGCDGPVAEAIDKIEKHINKKAHEQS